MATTHEHKIDNLDQPFYGPIIPPPTPTDPATTNDARPAPARRGAYALFCLAFRALTLVLIALGVVVLVLWLVYQPTRLKAYVDSAALARFDLNNGTTRLTYDLALNVSVRNPNRKQAVVYRRLEAVALYGGDVFGYADILPQTTRQGPKTTMGIRPSFQGQASSTAAALFGREKEEGFFNINVKLHTRVRLKFVVVDSVEYRPDVDCYIRVPDPTNAAAVAQGFQPTQCHVDDFS